MIVTVLRTRRKYGARQEYTERAERMSELATKMPGQVSHAVFIAEDGERATIVEFESEEALRAWSTHPGHADARKKGRGDFYADYCVQVCAVLRQPEFRQS